MELPALRDQPLRVVRPDAAGVDDLPCPHLVLAALLQIPYAGADHALALTQEADDAGAVRGVRPVGGGGAHHRGHIAGVVHLCVVVLNAPTSAAFFNAGATRSA